MRRYSKISLLVVCVFLLMVGCATPTPQPITVTVVADGTAQVISISTETTVSDVLRNHGIVYSDLDRVNPRLFDRVTDGMTIKIVRVREELIEEREIIPFERTHAPNESMAPGDSLIIQPGVNGEQIVTYRIVYEDGVEASRNLVRSFVVTPPKNEILMIGIETNIPTVSVTGSIAYISSQNAWIIRQNSANKRPLTDDGGVDGRVFELSEDGERLLFTRSNIAEAAGVEGETPMPTETPTGDEPFNSLWVVLDTSEGGSDPVRLDLNNILFAAWVPGEEQTIVYSTGEPRTGNPGWQANNDLWMAEISANGAILRSSQLLESSGGGIYGWYGAAFEFAPDGITLAWSLPDSVGVLIPDYSSLETEEESTEEATETEESVEPTLEATDEAEPPSSLPPAYQRQTLASFAPYNIFDFIWRPGLAWSPEGDILVTTTHGAALGAESPEDSPVFNLTALSTAGLFSTIDLTPRAGMWSLAQYSPVIDGESRLAYLQAINPLDSVTSRYHLVVMDRDGSNRRVVYPTEDEMGIAPGDLDYQGFVWSPNGQQIALIYQGNLYIVDTLTGIDQQLTQDGRASFPRWAP